MCIECRKTDEYRALIMIRNTAEAEMKKRGISPRIASFIHARIRPAAASQITPVQQFMKAERDLQDLHNRIVREGLRRAVQSARGEIK